ncbi:DUF3574 domain-containing protein [Fusibacter paucivorans]|nr:DUF3574 domain-containing protein [Fusibacter paucivorans]
MMIKMMGGNTAVRRKPRRHAIVTVLWLALMLTGCQIESSNEQPSNLLTETGTQYTMYIGLNDQDTYQQVIETEEAETIISEIALEYVDGFTMTNGTGAYKDEDNVITYENSIILTFIDVSEDQLQAIMDDVRTALNQHAVLLESTAMHYTFYEGTVQ